MFYALILQIAITWVTKAGAPSFRVFADILSKPVAFLTSNFTRKLPTNSSDALGILKEFPGGIFVLINCWRAVKSVEFEMFAWCLAKYLSATLVKCLLKAWAMSISFVNVWFWKVKEWGTILHLVWFISSWNTLESFWGLFLCNSIALVSRPFLASLISDVTLFLQTL